MFLNPTFFVSIFPLWK